jgi:hypothetical protein
VSEDGCKFCDSPLCGQDCDTAKSARSREAATFAAKAAALDRVLQLVADRERIGEVIYEAYIASKRKSMPPSWKPPAWSELTASLKAEPLAQADALSAEIARIASEPTASAKGGSSSA